MKYNFSKNTKARKIMIIATCCLSIILSAFSCIDVYADDLFSYQDSYNFSDIEFLHYADNDTDFQYATANTIDECQYLINSNLFTCPSSYSIDTSVFPNYVIIYNNSNHRFYVMYADEDAFVTVYKGQDGLVNLNSKNFDGNFRYRISRWSYPTGYVESLDDFTNSNPSGYDVFETSDSEEYTIFYSCSLYGYQIVASSVPIYVEPAPTNHRSDLYLDEVENVNPTYNGGGISDTDILNNDYLGENNYIGIVGSSIDNADLRLIIDFNENQAQELSTGKDISDSSKSVTYSYQISVNFYCDAEMSTSVAKDILDTYYGKNNWSSSDSGKAEFSKTFSGSISNVVTTNNISISSTVYNDEITTSNGKTAIKLCNWLPYNLDRSGTQSMSQGFFDSIGSISIAGFSAPTYKASSNCNPRSLYYDISADVYRNGTKITNTPIASTYNALTGQTNVYSNPGVSQSSVQQAVNNNNENKEPGDDGYVDPSGYNNTISVDNGGSATSNNTGGNSNSNIESGAIVNNNNPTITINNENSSKSESSAGLGSNIITTIIKYIVSDKKSSSDVIEGLIDENGWSNVLTSYYSWIPDSFWVLLFSVMGTCSGILIVGFIISIVLRFIS